jgi:diaminopimelate decarboxylase
VKVLAENDFINAIHVHTGSGGMTLGQMADGAAGAANLALEVNALRVKMNAQKITVVDIGGGLPVSWGEAGQKPSFADYSAELRQKAPSLFDGTSFTRVVTEMGAIANCRFAFFASLCEVTKPTDAGMIAMIHAGSDQFLRACYAPQMRAPHPVHIFDPSGVPKTGETSLHDIAGPLCFAGDILCSAELPAVEVVTHVTRQLDLASSTPIVVYPPEFPAEMYAFKLIFSFLLRH